MASLLRFPPSHHPPRAFFSLYSPGGTKRPLRRREVQWYFCFHLCREIIGESNCRFVPGHRGAVCLKAGVNVNLNEI